MNSPALFSVFAELRQFAARHWNGVVQTLETVTLALSPSGRSATSRVRCPSCTGAGGQPHSRRPGTFSTSFNAQPRRSLLMPKRAFEGTSDVQ